MLMSIRLLLRLRPLLNVRQGHSLAMRSYLHGAITHVVLIRNYLDVVVLDDDGALSSIALTSELSFQHLMHVWLVHVVTFLSLRASCEVIAFCDDVRVRRIDDLFALLLALVDVFDADSDIVEVDLFDQGASWVKVNGLVTLFHESLHFILFLFTAFFALIQLVRQRLVALFVDL